MLTLYFSGTGNTRYIAEMFSHKMGATCLSIEKTMDFSKEIKAHDTIAFCYPIYGSRVPRNIREFVVKHMSELTGKNIIILVTQLLFSGDGARVFTDMFWEGTINVIYAEHFNMPNNVCNFPLLRKPSQRKIQRYLAKARAKMERTCNNINNGVVVKRGFSRPSQILGSIQGRVWQGNSKEQTTSKSSAEHKARTGVKIHKHCNACKICVSICPMQNLEKTQNIIEAKGNCIACYRCVNRCPSKAITVMMFHRKPKWQYDGI